MVFMPEKLLETTFSSLARDIEPRKQIYSRSSGPKFDFMSCYLLGFLSFQTTEACCDGWYQLWL